MMIKDWLKPFGVDLFCLGKKFLVFNLISRNLKTKYRRSVLGLLWTLASPLSMALIYYFVFKVILNVQQPYYTVVLLSGVLPWTFFSQSVMEGTDSIVGAWGLISKVPIPLPVFPYVGALTNLFTLFLSMPIVFGAIAIAGAPVSFSLVLIPFYYLALFLITYSISSTLAVTSVFLRDLKHIIGIGMQVWFYATPVVYQSSMIPEKYRWILDLNPIGQIFASLQKIVATGGWPDLRSVGITGAWVIFLTLGTAFLHRYYFKEVVERI